MTQTFGKIFSTCYEELYCGLKSIIKSIKQSLSRSDSFDAVIHDSGKLSSAYLNVLINLKVESDYA